MAKTPIATLPADTSDMTVIETGGGNLELTTEGLTLTGDVTIADVRGEAVVIGPDYVVQPDAPARIAGKRAKPGDIVTLSEDEARYELLMGHIAPKAD